MNICFTGGICTPKNKQAKESFLISYKPSQRTSRPKEKTFSNLTVQYLEKYSGIQYNSWQTGWHLENRQEVFLAGGGERLADGRGEGLSATGDRGQAAISLMPDIDGTGLVPCWIQFYPPS